MSLMSGLAHLLLAAGHAVYGDDDAERHERPAPRATRRRASAAPQTKPCCTSKPVRPRAPRKAAVPPVPKAPGS